MVNAAVFLTSGAISHTPLLGDGSECWDGYSTDAFKEWGKFLKLAIPGLVMTCAEFWAFEIQTLFAGYFGTEYLSAQVGFWSLSSVRADRRFCAFCFHWITLGCEDVVARRFGTLGRLFAEHSW